MKVHLAGPSSAALLATASLFRERGDSVSLSDPVPLDADLYLFCTGHEAMKRLTQGLVVLDLRNDPGQEPVTWASYADLCLVSDSTTRTLLVEAHGYEPERIFVVSSDSALLNLVDQACHNALPPAAVEKRGEPMIESQRAQDETPLASSQRILTLAARLEAADRHADVMLRDYQIRSKLPLVGPFVAWIRRNLTSHLREPYLDPTLERQVALNHDLIAILREMLRQQADLEARLARPHKEHDDD